MRSYAILLTMIILGAMTTICSAQTSQGQPAVCQTVPPAGCQSWSCPPSGSSIGQAQYQQGGAAMGAGAAPSAAMSMGAGVGMGANVMMHAVGITANDSFVFVLRGNEVIKLSADDLHVISTQTLSSATTASAGMSSGAVTGAGPTYTPSGAEMGTARSTAQQFISSLGSMPANQMEQNFMQAAIQNHAGAIAWSKLAATKATHTDLQRFARSVINDESKINTRFAGFLKNWYGAKANTAMTATDTEELNRLKSLSRSAFEIAYMRAMLTHFNEAAALSNLASQKATHPELKTIATDMLKTHAKQIQQLRDWLSKWYNMTM